MSVAGAHAANLSTPYRPVAVYFEDADCVEFVRADAPCVYRRIDEFLTLIVDMDRRDLIGFRLKGFRNFYIRHFDKLNTGIKPEFLSLVSILEKIIESFAQEFIDDNQRQAAYRQARDLAHAENAALRDLPKAASL